MAQRSGRVLTLTLALLLACMTTVELWRGGLFDFSRPPGMVDEPCAKQTGLTAMLRGDAERMRVREQVGLCDYREDNARLIASGKPPRVVMIGDSIIEMWGKDDPAFFAHDIANRGIVGQTSRETLLRFEQDVIALRPRTVHILVGLNDIAGNAGLNRPEDFQANIRAMVTLAEANGIAVVLGSLPPAREFYWRPGNDPRPRIAELNRWLRGFAAERELAFADYHTLLADGRGLSKPQFDLDGVHPNRAAFAAMRPIAEAAIAQAEAQRPTGTTARSHDRRALVSAQGPN